LNFKLVKLSLDEETHGGPQMVEHIGEERESLKEEE
jgi:hypothetical protein